MRTENRLTNLVTIIGRGVPANYEISVNGAIEMVGADPLEKATIVSGRSVEGAIETGIRRFRFSGQMANVHLVDWNGIPAPESASTPDVHVDYGASGRNDSN
ncbi:hypothetical protein [Natronococcus wangiae]|uniref:hypothetical protein n=1 Tax=Natronococcus wangiae TaxID=3068275 RepID=UPI0027402F40|nr:hypothetical protein [Natronococcus sp. AD5]